MDNYKQLDLNGNVYQGRTFEDIWKEIRPNPEQDKKKQETLGQFFPVVKKQYPQDWKAYDASHTNQYPLFLKLLTSLVENAIPLQEQIGKGRKKISVRTKLICMAIKVYFRADLRKTESILKELQASGYIDKVPCFKSIDNFFLDKELSCLLSELILLTSLPLALIENTGAIDSTGFSVSKLVNWNNFKWGKIEGKERIWRKAHAVIGTTTNVVISVEVTEKNVGDATMVDKVIGKKTKYFAMKDFVADMAYSSRNIVKFLSMLGLNPWIPFKSNASGQSKGVRLWHTLYDKFIRENKIYMQKYHRRSNVETVFHMVKQRFGDNLLTKHLDSNINEIKVKFLCHNITVLIQEAFERDIKVDFEECVKIKSLCNY